MMSWVHTRAKSRLSWQNCVQEVVCKKVDRENATPDVAERPSKQARPRFWSFGVCDGRVMQCGHNGAICPRVTQVSSKI